MNNKTKSLFITIPASVGLLFWAGSAHKTVQIEVPSPMPTQQEESMPAPATPTLLDRMVVPKTPAPTATPIPSKTPYQEVNVATPEPKPSPSPSVAPSPVIVYVPVSATPTPNPTAMPETPTPVAPLVRVQEVVFKAKNDNPFPEEVILNVHTDIPGIVRVQFIVDDGTIMDHYANSKKDNQELSDFVKEYAAGRSEGIIESENGQFTASQFPKGHIWFSVVTINSEGQGLQYLRNGNEFDWNNNFENI